MVYGKFWGFWLAYLGALSGATSLYILARFISKDRLVNHVMEKYSFDLKGLNPWKVFGVLFAARLFPVVPTCIINIGSAVSGIPFRIFFFSSMLGKILWAVVYVSLGNYLIKTHNLVGTLAALGCILLVSLIGVHYCRQRLPIRRVRQQTKSGLDLPR